MKIVSWNCAGKFRAKFEALRDLNADIYVIQECENPEHTNDSLYKSFASNYLWTGENKNKGLGIFAKSEILLKENPWDKFCLRHFISAQINNQFDIVAVWACKPYIAEYYVYQSINLPHFNKDTVIIGDFNSNAKWDKPKDARTHKAIVEQLKNIGLVSAYHHLSNDIQGHESVNTFYLYRHLDRGYHIDHCFASPTHIGSYKILNGPAWLAHSDHMPIILEYNK